jgi:hypothetical protein
MNMELAPPNHARDIDQAAPPVVLERVGKQGEMVKPGEIELVTTSSGTILYVPQSLDE